ncbi:YhcH/YjgK/YiaL family protein [Ruminiclostridium papyrosolvens]|uniref:YhcH/YjgK/YiaL family protein n=1 Tax=Ruminiclostridium papyrosolvens C7 TaxID=1330534 RepID=U4QZR4_9FIRM|nr:YhcH/YjgK/YiaL family protein [Ruminiclostridium papyrosolvens]EPR10497.1 hypothetical protein L323_12880 [Ruminiclostridium papyrosolvens C7]
MIFDNVSNCKKYEALHSDFEKAFSFLKRADLDSIAPGRYDIDGNDVYALVQEYETKSLADSIYEAHRKYIDIQYLIEGVENMGYSQIEKLNVLSPYNEENDFLTLSGEPRLILYNPREFFILFPEDAHMPGISHGEKGKIRKVVIKVRVK